MVNPLFLCAVLTVHLDGDTIDILTKEVGMPKRVLSGCEVGTRIGKRVVIDHVLNRGRTRCVLKCDCGRIDEVYAHLFKARKALQCIDCSRAEHSSRMKKQNHRLADLSGARFGKWTVIERGENRQSKGREFVCWVCKCDCGAVKTVPARALLSGKSRSCGCLILDTKTRKSQERTSNPEKIKRYYSGDGYVLLYYPEHPNSDSNGQLREHVFVMSEHLGRPIEDGESVHHKNGIRDDNRLENLELWSSSHPKGQRVNDVIDFCIGYLTKYKPSVFAIKGRNEK